MRDSDASIIADLELLTNAIIACNDHLKRETLSIAYHYRLTQLDTPNTQELLQQYRKRYNTITNNNEEYR
jgi:hypothetical protein